jgi:hypothetical protein
MNGKASTIKKTFSRATSVAIDIQADKSVIWALLTNAEDYPRWNSTITSLEGDFKVGGKLALKSYMDAKRTFKLKIKSFNPESSMSWGDAQGTRVFLLEEIDDKTVRFSMNEKLGGPLFPLFAGMIPDFDESFEKFAADLKKEAEAVK